MLALTGFSNMALYVFLCFEFILKIFHNPIILCLEPRFTGFED